MNMASLFHHMLERVCELARCYCAKAITALRNRLAGFIDCISMTRRTTRLVLIQQFFRLQHLITQLKKAMLLHYLVYPF